MITTQDIENNTMFIGDQDIADLGVLVQSFKVGGVKLTSNTFQGENRTNFNVLYTSRGMRTITVSLFFTAQSRRELSIIKSKIDAMLMVGKVDIFLPDDFFYSSYLTDAGEEQILGVEDNKVIALCTYTLEGIRHDALETIAYTAGGRMLCKSTVPKTDCRLTCTASQDYQQITIGPVTFLDVSSGDVLVADGILGRILQNGAPCAGNMVFTHFPSLAPGYNEITSPEDLTVEYYPTY